ncbi:hypothetical protein GGR60_002736 [Xanthomonas arboricola]|uniref:hypothetical protein n=1 Tax=Xanthomonas euroxanthea TaxID=2259622 RepID=UPI0016AE17B4|nr:hypothetical protein [Xanthomonas euroxanthea]NJC38182.1 hypothetical protein [Xanthomonas euroxanthea]
MITLAQLPMLVCHLRQIADDGVRSHGDAWAHGVRFAADQLEGGEVYTVPPAPSDPVGPDRMAIKLLVAAGFVTEEKANESLRIAHGFGGDLGQPAPAAVPVDVRTLLAAEFDKDEVTAAAARRLRNHNETAVEAAAMRAMQALATHPQPAAAKEQRNG